MNNLTTFDIIILIIVAIAILFCIATTLFFGDIEFIVQSGLIFSFLILGLEKSKKKPEKK